MSCVATGSGLGEGVGVGVGVGSDVGVATEDESDMRDDRIDEIGSMITLDDVAVLEVSDVEDTDIATGVEVVDEMRLGVCMEVWLELITVALLLVSDDTVEEEEEEDEGNGMLIGCVEVRIVATNDGVLDRILDWVLELVPDLLEDAVVPHRPYFA